MDCAQGLLFSPLYFERCRSSNDFHYLSWCEFQHEVHGFISWQCAHIWRDLKHAVIVSSPRHLR